MRTNEIRNVRGKPNKTAWRIGPEDKILPRAALKNVKKKTPDLVSYLTRLSASLLHVISQYKSLDVVLKNKDD